MPALDALHAEVALRGAVGALLLLHVVTLALPGPRPAARAALAGSALSVAAYTVCQRPELLLHLPRPLAYAVLTLCVASAGWLWAAARALFDDGFRWSAPVWAPLAALTLLGLASNLPYFPDGAGPYRHFEDESWVVRLGQLHALANLVLHAAALWVVSRDWRSDLVAARRAARRWVALGIGSYSTLALVVELAVRGHPVGPWLPLLHLAGIGLVAAALAVFVARRSLAEVLGGPPGVASIAAPAATPELAAVPPPPADDRAGRALAALQQAMAEQRLYRRDGLTLADLAAALHMSEAPLRELINQRLGYRNFNDFLHHHRLQEATERLSREDLPILTIALECGYGSIGPFNRAFRQRLGMTPTEFRAGHRLARATTTR